MPVVIKAKHKVEIKP